MPKLSVKETLQASSDQAFRIVHDYARRLEWDTLLQTAYLEGAGSADVGVTAVCKGKATLLGIEMRTIYVTFKPGKVAAVKLTNRPPFFDSFAASIRHIRIDDQHSELIYELNFKARPAFLRLVLHPIMGIMLKWETRKRLRSLKKFIDKNRVAVSDESPIW